MGSLDGHKIGFIGLGLMGRPMAQNLKSAGANIIVYNRSQEVMNAFRHEGVQTTSSPINLVQMLGSDSAVILMLPDTKALEEVLLGPNGLISGLQKGCLIIDMGTSSVGATKRFAKKVSGAGGQYIDAPVSGGTISAKEGTLTIMAGGNKESMILAMPIFNVLGKKITHVGPAGTGQIAKAANQIIVGLSIGAVAEALTLAKRAGADPITVCDSLTGGFADSRVLAIHGQRMLYDNFKPGARSTIQQKDLIQALELAKDLGLELPTTKIVKSLYDKLINAGHGTLDHSALIKIIDPD